MTTYIKYQCSICRRTKDIEEDPVRVAPNKCTITKGCGGLLLAVEKTAIQNQTLPVAGVEDWYPRGEIRTVATRTTEQETVGLATSATGAFTIAVRTTTPNILPATLTLQLIQRRTENVAFQEYVFKPTVSGTVFTGRDANGKILRIDSAAIADDRVSVRVNGVIQTPALSTNTVTFATPVSAGSNVTIRVQVEKDTIERSVTLTRNTEQTPTLSRGAWANVNVVYRQEGVGPDSKVGLTSWYLYSSDALAGLTVGKLKIGFSGITLPTMILLAHAPYRSVDRYLDFVLPVENINDDFVLEMETSSAASLVVPRSLVVEFFPPLLLYPSGSFIVPDSMETTTSSAVNTDASTPVLTSAVILGPK